MKAKSRGSHFFAALLGIILLIGGCRNGETAVFPQSPRATTAVFLPNISNQQPTPTPVPPTATPLPPPTLDDFWAGTAQFIIDIPITGLPLGESETLIRPDGLVWAYLHASFQSAGVVDQCGDPVPFPGCTIIMQSSDGGATFANDAPVCQFACQQCPCHSEIDHIDQQQYPRITAVSNGFLLAYEYLGRTMLRRSADGISWGAPERVANTGIWKEWLRYCNPVERIGQHPFVPYDFECLAGAPPGIFAIGETVYIFVGVGQNPGGMGCFVGQVDWAAADYVRCKNNPLIRGAASYGDIALKGAAANPFFGFRTISSADVVQVGERFYMLFEGIRGPGSGDAGDTQFGLGIARSLTNEIDGDWETYSGNPILLDLPGNVGVGHADFLLKDGRTYLYTSLDGQTRSRLQLVWHAP